MKPTSYKFRLSHNGNEAIVKIMATSIDQAKVKICEIEDCPVSALNLIK